MLTSVFGVYSSYIKYALYMCSSCRGAKRKTDRKAATKSSYELCNALQSVMSLYYAVIALYRVRSFYVRRFFAAPYKFVVFFYLFM